MQAYYKKTEKFFVIEEKKFYRIGYRFDCQSVFLSKKTCSFVKKMSLLEITPISKKSSNVSKDLLVPLSLEFIVHWTAQ